MNKDPRAVKTESAEVNRIEPSFAGEGLRVGVVMARFNSEIGEGLLAACLNELQHLGVMPAQVSCTTVAGALEIPLLLKRMAQSQRFDALVALGAVIRGETYHFEVVANDACRAIMAVQLETGVPVANGVLTCDDEDQALSRMRQKGIDCARVAIEMVHYLRLFRE